MIKFRVSGDAESRAKELAGNWTKWNSFGPGQQLRELDAKNFCLVYTRNRDSGLIDQSNAHIIEQLLKPFKEVPEDAPDDYTPDVQDASCSHWACGYVEGYIIRIRNDAGEITPAFQMWADIQAKLDDYPILDCDHYSVMETEAGYDNFKQAMKGFASRHDLELPDDAQDKIYDWFCDQGDMENTDDRGWWPKDEQLMEACESLGYMTPTTEESKA
jgi:hypothetical protein